MTRPILRTVLALAMLLPLVPATAAAQPPAAATPGAGVHPSEEGASFLGFGCFRDPTGDVPDPRADLQEVCVRYFPEQPAAVVVSMDAAAPFDPLGDDAWLNPQTQAAVGFSIDGDEAIDRTFTMRREDDALVGVVTDADGEALEGCGTIVQVAQGGFLRGQLNASCIDDATDVRVVATLAVEPEPGTAVAVDRVPDAGVSVAIPRRDESPVCANATTESGELLTVRRLACGGVIAGTEPISQAVATSQFVFDNPNTVQIDPYQADWVVLARDDDFADALAGSSLSFGQGPLLFTYSPRSVPADRDPGRLADITLAEILRVLPRGRTVYLLGGEAALAPGIDAQLQDLGYDVVRFAGVGREQTAGLIAGEVSRIVGDFKAATGFEDVNMVLVANARNWPDAVLAGSVGAFWGMPILLVNAELPLHPDTVAALDALRPDYIHNVGGSTVISTDVAIAIREHANAQGYALGRPGEDVTTPGTRWVNFCAAGEEPRYVCRWGGDTRFGTAAAITQLNRDMVGRFSDMPFIPDSAQQFAVAINLGGLVDSRNFAYVLSAATVSGRFGGAVFVPTEGTDLTPETRNALCNTPGAERFVEQVRQLVVVGDTDLIADSFTQQVKAVVEGGC